MDGKRAKEIMESEGVYEVRYKGFPVWIEEVNGDHAKVRSMDTGRHYEVMVLELVEGIGLL
jgi:small acid-soluble spore protein H (minor)